MIEVRITNWMLEKAKRLAMKDKAKYGFHNTRLIRTDMNRVIGKLGEVVISCYFNTELTNTRSYDIIINQERVEIKSRKISTDIIELDEICSVVTPKKGCDRYMFVFVHSSLSKVWIVGTCLKEEFDYKSFYGCPLIKNVKCFPSHMIYIKDLEDVKSWQSKFGRTVKVNGLMPTQVGL